MSFGELLTSVSSAPVNRQVMGLKDISNMNANSHQTKLFRKVSDIDVML